MIGAFFRRWLDVVRDSVRIWWLAPAIPLIAAIPEFVQHVAEIQLGMFDSREAARALANDPTRWAFGYFKLTGYLVAILAAARFWAARREGLRWFDQSGIAWRVFTLGLVLFVGLSLVGYGIDKLIEGSGDAVETALSAAYSIATLPITVLLIAGLVGDRAATLASVYRKGWLQAARIVLFSATVLVPLMALHSFNHKLAMEAEPAIVWALMVFDSLVVGLLAAGWGTAIEHGYRSLSDDEAALMPRTA